MFWKKNPSPQDILRGLHDVVDASHQPQIVTEQGNVIVTLTVDPRMPRDDMAALQRKTETHVHAIKGVRSVRVVLTAEREASPVQQKPIEQPRAVAPFVRHIIAVSSGKGGVGKSTIAANLAVALGKTGLRVGLLDADVYGPSVPMLLGVRQQKPEQHDDYLVPVKAHGIDVISMGFLVDEEAPMVWRGPMVQSALLQMLRDVRWGTEEKPLDVLVLDMPPGTGDTQLTLAQKVKLDGAVIVSTPQDIALLDTVKGVRMFEKLAVPILGVIENMSYFCCPNCGHEAAIFGRHGAENRARDLGVDFLGGVPLDPVLRECSDNGVPAATREDTVFAGIFSTMARKIIGKLGNEKGGQKKPPRIIFE